MAEPALFRKFPQLASTIPWVELASVPTPVESLAATGSSTPSSFYIKRDDLSGEPYGGNKVRKLEFLLGAARQRGSKRLITVGAAGSHHALATTIYGRQLGFEVTLVLFPQPLTPHVREVLMLDQAFGAELRFTRRMELIPAALFATTLRYRSDRAFVIPAGGSDATGTLGYVTAALELAEQVARGEVPEPATVVVAAGTLGTAAGLALGFAIAGMKTEIKAVRITSRIVTNERVLARLIRGTEVLLQRAGANVDVANQAIARVELLHEHIGRGYGIETDEGARAAEHFSRQGILLDPTYTAKAAAAFIAKAAHLPQPVMFWQTLSAAEPTGGEGDAVLQALPKPFRDYILSTGA
jgi:1-aminocyclopropane-1-carboxylate deaminase/D-cysteine desulfhydrase-like pyridoxal-dependent ACC family enzyme